MIFLFAGCAAPADDAARVAAGRSPDIMLILVDALRRDHVGRYGYPRPTTPFLDELAARGVVFEDALAQAPQTLNSTASLFTSRSFPWLLRGVEHGPIPGVAPERRKQWAKTPRLASANLTLAEALHRGGYQTAAFFNNPHHHSTSGFGQGFDEARLLDRDPGQGYARVDSVADAFFAWHDAIDRHRPFFAYLHLMEPHNPYRPPDRYREAFPPGPGRHRYRNGPPEPGFTDDDLNHMRALYDAEIRYLDDGLRALVDELDRRGSFDHSLIVITADHGEEFLDHGGLGHGKTVELEQLRVPLVFAGGAVEQWAGASVRQPVRNLDLAPTLLEIAGLDVAPEFEGRSLLRLIRGDASDTAPISFAWNGRLRSLTSADWHCMRDLGSDNLVLYHRSSDPTGTTNVAGTHPEIAALCLRELERIEAIKLETDREAHRLKAIETGGEPPPESSEVIEQLEALGYVEN